MKYIIARQFSFKSEKFEVSSGSEIISTVKATLSKENKGQFNVKLSNLMSEHVGEGSCIVEPDPNKPHNYLIYLKNDLSNKKTRFGELLYQFCNYDDYLYTIIIGEKLYKVRSCDLKYRQLAVIDTIKTENGTPTNHYSRLDCPETLFQVIDSFSKSNQKYHVTINDKEWPLGYLAITILLHLHQSKQNTD